MNKKYIAPSIKVRKVITESSMLENSINATAGLPEGTPTPTAGGTATGGSAGSAGSKSNSWTAWGTDDEE